MTDDSELYLKAFFTVAILLAIVPFVIGFIRKRKVTNQWMSLAQELEMDFTATLAIDDLDPEYNFELFKTGKLNQINHGFRKIDPKMEVSVFQYQYDVPIMGAYTPGYKTYTRQQTVFFFKSSELTLPEFILKPRNWYAKLLTLFSKNHAGAIPFPHYPDFERSYFVEGLDTEGIQAVMSPALIQFVEENKGISIEIRNHCLLMYRTGRTVAPSQLKHFLNSGYGLCQLLISQ